MSSQRENGRDSNGRSLPLTKGGSPTPVESLPMDCSRCVNHTPEVAKVPPRELSQEVLEDAWGH